MLMLQTYSVWHRSQEEGGWWYCDRVGLSLADARSLAALEKNWQMYTLVEVFTDGFNPNEG